MEDLTDDEIREMGYEPTSEGWVPIKKGKRSKPRSAPTAPTEVQEPNQSVKSPGPEVGSEPRSRPAASPVKKKRPTRPVRGRS